MSPAITLVWSAIIASITGLAGGYFGATLRETSSSRKGFADEITTHRLRIVNEAGQECGRFEGGSPAMPRSCYLRLGGMTPDDPIALLSVDNLEGTPTARVYMRSSRVEPGKTGIVILQSSMGRPKLALSETNTDSIRQLVELGTWMTDNPSVLHLERPGQTSDWPR